VPRGKVLRIYDSTSPLHMPHHVETRVPPKRNVHLGLTPSRGDPRAVSVLVHTKMLPWTGAHRLRLTGRLGAPS